MADIILNAKNVGNGKNIKVTEEYIERTPPFFKLGDSMGYNASRFPVYPDLTGTMMKLSKGAHWMFWKLLGLRDINTNIAVFTPKGATETQKVQRAYKELLSYELIIRVRRSHYLFNPAVLEPKTEKYEKVFLHWNSFKKGTK